MCERQRIGSLRVEGISSRRMVTRIGRSLSTVSRELAQRSAPWDPSYEPAISHLRTYKRMRRPKPGKAESNKWLQHFVQAKWDELWSRAQISLHLRQHFPSRLDGDACQETISQALYRPGDGIPRALTRNLRTGRPLRRRQRRPNRHTTCFVAAIRSIDDRSIEVINQQQPGHRGT